MTCMWFGLSWSLISWMKTRVYYQYLERTRDPIRCLTYFLCGAVQLLERIYAYLGAEDMIRCWFLERRCVAWNGNKSSWCLPWFSRDLCAWKEITTHWCCMLTKENCSRISSTSTSRCYLLEFNRVYVEIVAGSLYSWRKRYVCCFGK
jgi:hypothetical protein